MKKNYFSCYKKGDILANFLIMVICFAFTGLTTAGFLEVIDLKSSIHSYVTPIEAIVGGAVCFTILVISAVLGGMQAGEVIRRIHMNWVNRH